MNARGCIALCTIRIVGSQNIVYTLQINYIAVFENEIYESAAVFG